MGYKLVVDEQRDAVVIGVGKDGCHPKNYEVVKDDDGEEGCLWAPEPAERWAMAMANLPHFVEKAEGAWTINPLNPKYRPPAKTKAKVEPSAAAATVTEAPTEELPLLEKEETTTMTTETTPPVDDPGTQEAPVRPEETQEAPVGPEETPEAQTQPGDPPATEAPTPAAPGAAGNGSWRYYVAGQAFETVHEALRAHGVAQEEIDAHKYWHRYDRLPKVHADAIRRERVGSA